MKEITEVIKAVKNANVFVFDFDGVLIDSSDAEKDIIINVLKNHGYQLGPKDFAEFSGIPWTELFSRLGKKFFWTPFMEKTVMEECLEISFKTVFPVAEGLIHKITELRLAGYRIGILTNRSYESFVNAAELSKIDLDLFDFISTLDTPGHHKPSPLVWNYLHAQEKIYSDDRIILFGDTISDYKCTEHETISISFFGINKKKEEFETAKNLPPELIFANTLLAIDFVFETKKIIQ